jgi:Flp pilus assembly protein TadD
MALRVSGKNQSALAAIRRHCAEHPQDVRGHVQKGAILEDMKRWKAASRAYEHALKLDASVGSARRNLDQLRAFRLLKRPRAQPAITRVRLLADVVKLMDHHRYESALQKLRLLQGLDPHNPWPSLYRAAVLESAGHSRSAKASYRAIRGAHPAFAPAAVNLVVLLAKEGQYDEARLEAEAAVRAFPTNRRLRYLKHAIEDKDREAPDSLVFKDLMYVPR